MQPDDYGTCACGAAATWRCSHCREPVCAEHEEPAAPGITLCGPCRAKVRGYQPDPTPTAFGWRAGD